MSSAFGARRLAHPRLAPNYVGAPGSYSVDAAEAQHEVIVRRAGPSCW